jgi:LuxR family maltose regulon positive regulatory protein
MAIPLLTTKLYTPPRRPSVVPRPRLTARLVDAQRLQHRLLLISAKAGAGKTTLASEWLPQQDRPAAWLSLDQKDNDPRRFASYLLAALQQVGVEVRGIDPSRWQAPELPPAEALTAELINEVAASAMACLLVLDDYHLIQSNWIHEAVGFLAENQPPAMQLVIITRTDPPWPLSRLRGRGQVTEIRDHDLRFTPEEAAQFLNESMGLGLPADAVSALEARTEGWIAGLQMAAISMQGRKQADDQAAFVAAFGGTHRYILDYLLEEVLNLQAPVVQDFLIETSILERMCAPLCDAVRFSTAETPSGSSATAVRVPTALTSAGSGLTEDGPELTPGGSESTASGSERTAFAEEVSGHGAATMAGRVQETTALADASGVFGSRAILAQLERTNLFLSPLDDERRWYRYHHLFADLLQSTLTERRSAEEIRKLHARASRWHQAEGSLEEAMIHAMAAQDYDRAATMIEDNVASMLSRSEAPLLLGWIKKLPEEIVRGRPWIDVYRATTLALSGRLEQVDALLDGVEDRLAPGDPQASALTGHIAAVRAYVANLRGDAPRAIEMAAITRECLPDEHLNARGMAAYALAETYLAMDDIDGASAASREMLDVGEKTGRLLMAIPALGDLAAINIVQGRLFQAEEHLQAARRWLVDKNALDSRVRCPYEAGMAGLLHEWNQLDRAHAHAQTGLEYTRHYGVYSLLVASALALMRILQAQGDVDGALEALHEAERTVQTRHVRLATRIEWSAARVVQWLAVGDVETASHCAGEFDNRSELVQMATARLRLAQGRPEEAQRLLWDQLALAEAGGRIGRCIEILALQALALEALDRPDEANAALSGALAMARPEGYLRLFLDLGKPMRRLLERAEARSAAKGAGAARPAPVARDYVRELLEAFRQGPPVESRLGADVEALSGRAAEVLVEPLTDRELEVLRLLAGGLTNKEMAGRLVVAPSTVKQHLKNIYSKLDVHSRTQAVARGRELGLL